MNVTRGISVGKNSGMLDHNEYSLQAMLHLLPLPQTEGADLLLDEARLHNRRRRVSGDEGVETLVTTQKVNNGQVIMEIHGYMGMEKEKRHGNTVFLYEGLAGRTISIDTPDAPRRSCCPNSVLKHVLGSRTILGIMVVAIMDIPNGTEILLPFNPDWKESNKPMECVEHLGNIQKCPFEKERLKTATRHAPVPEEVEPCHLEEESEETEAALESYLMHHFLELIDVYSPKQDFQLPSKLADVSKCAPWVREAAAKRNFGAVTTRHNDSSLQFEVVHQEADDVPAASEAPKTETPDRRSQFLQLIRESLENVDFELPSELFDISKCAPWVGEVEMKMLKASMKKTPLADRRSKKRKVSSAAEENAQGAKRRRI